MRKTITRRIVTLLIVTSVFTSVLPISSFEMISRATEEEEELEIDTAIKIKVGEKLRAIDTVDGEFEKKNGVIKYRTDEGKIYKGGFFERNGKIYHSDKKGIITRGWYKYKGNYYFFGRKKGALVKSKKVEYVSIGKDGTVKNTKVNIGKVKTYLKAAKVVAAHTKPSDSKSTKLLKCFKWMRPFGYAQYRTMKTMMKRTHWKRDWDIVFANDIFDKHRGCCVSESAAFALMAKECGYKKVTLCCDTEHAWVDIGGRLYDPLFAESKSFRKNYNAAYWDYRAHAAISKKIA